jgi:hypothetical protein
MEVIATVALEGAQVVGATELAPELLEEGPAVLRRLGPGLPHEVGPVVLNHRVVVEERVVHVEEEDDVSTRAHGRSDSARGFDSMAHQACWSRSRISLRASAGPSLPAA